MHFKDLVTYYGSQANAAKAVGTSPQVVSAWKKNGIPLGRQYEIQILTGGHLRASKAQRVSQRDGQQWSDWTTPPPRKQLRI